MNEQEVQVENVLNSDDVASNAISTADNVATTTVSNENFMETTQTNIPNTQPLELPEFNVLSNNDSNQTELASNSTENNQQS